MHMWLGLGNRTESHLDGKNCMNFLFLRINAKPMTTSIEGVSLLRNQLNSIDFTKKSKTKNKEERESKHETRIEEREDVSS